MVTAFYAKWKRSASPPDVVTGLPPVRPTWRNLTLLKNAAHHPISKGVLVCPVVNPQPAPVLRRQASARRERQHEALLTLAPDNHTAGQGTNDDQSIPP
jgi:hypothetical protein